MTVIGGYCVPHLSALNRGRSALEAQGAGVVADAMDLVRTELAALAPDVVVLVTSDHYVQFFLDNFPMFCLGINAEFSTAGDSGMERRLYRGAPELARHVLDGLVASGFDLSFSANMELDHGFATPLAVLESEPFAVLPLFQNCTTRPLPRLDRCVELGRSLRSLLDPRPERVVVIGAGGLSHWLGVRGMGRVNEGFDESFLDAIAAPDLDGVLRLSDDDVETAAGNGGQEIRNWLTAWACAGEGPADVLGYRGVPEWITGLGVARLTAMAEASRP